MANYLLIAEKASVMDKIRETYEKHKEEVTAKLGGEIYFTCAAGHICRYKLPKEYPQWNIPWYEIKLPMIPEKFEVVPVEGQESKLQKMKGIMDRPDVDSIIIATDSDVEGCNIAFNILEYLKLGKYAKTTYRFFESSLTDAEILKSLLNMTLFWFNDRDKNMLAAGLCRAKLDWLVGMSYSTGLTVKTKAKPPLSIGRVKAPVMKMIVENDKACNSFKKSFVYQIRANYAEGFYGTLLADDAGDSEEEKKKGVRYFETPDLQAAEDKIATLAFNQVIVTEAERKPVSENAPRLFKLLTLQEEAGKKFNYTPEETENYLEKLYLSEYCSYPRSDCEFISTEKAQEMGQIAKACCCVPELLPIIHSFTQDTIDEAKKSPCVNDEKVKSEAHDAIIPTAKKPNYDTLPEGEKNIYTMICKRFIMQFLPKYVRESQTVTAVNGEFAFKSYGSRTLEKGWTVLRTTDEESDEDAEIGNTKSIPQEIEEDTILTIETYSLYEKKAQPPKRYTMASMVKAMESVAKLIDDKELAKIMNSAKGLGTPATRGSILNELVQKKYIEVRNKTKQIFPTELGIKYVELLDLFPISDPKMAAVWESKFQAVREGKLKYEDVLDEVINALNTFVDDLENMNCGEVIGNGPIDSIACPYCNKPIVSRKWGYACAGSKYVEKDETKVSCNFSVSNFDGKLSKEELKNLVTKGKTKTINKIDKDKEGKYRSAKIVLNPAGSQYPTSREYSSHKKPKGSKNP